MSLTYTALGDSLTAGVGATFSSGYVKRYAQMLEHLYKTPIQVNIHAKPKITTAELLHLIANPQVRRDIQEANIITMSIGGNDLLQGNRMFMKQQDPAILEEAYFHFRQNIHTIIHQITQIHSQMPHLHHIIQILGLYNPYPELSHSEAWVQRFNTALFDLNSQTVRYVDLHSPFAYYGKSVRSLGIHPNGKGYQLIAEQLRQTLI